MYLVSRTTSHWLHNLQYWICLVNKILVYILISIKPSYIFLHYRIYHHQVPMKSVLHMMSAKARKHLPCQDQSLVKERRDLSSHPPGDLLHLVIYLLKNQKLPIQVWLYFDMTFIFYTEGTNWCKDIFCVIMKWQRPHNQFQWQ